MPEASSRRTGGETPRDAARPGARGATVGRSARLGVVAVVAFAATCSALVLAFACAPAPELRALTLTFVLAQAHWNGRRLAGGAGDAACRLRPILRRPTSVDAASIDLPCFSQQGYAGDSRRAHYHRARRAPGA